MGVHFGAFSNRTCQHHDVEGVIVFSGEGRWCSVCGGGNIFAFPSLLPLSRVMFEKIVGAKKGQRLGDLSKLTKNSPNILPPKIVILTPQTATTCLFNPLNRRNLLFTAICVDSQLI